MNGRPTKRKADGRERSAFPNQNTQRNSTAPADGPQRFVVLCEKFDGRRVEFQRYAARSQAESVAAQLRAVGCAASVEPL